MNLGGTYSTGTVSTDPGNNKHLVFSGALLGTQGEQGDWILANGAIGFVASVDGDDDVTLEMAWTGGTLTSAPYTLIKMSWLRYDAALTQQKVRDLIALLEAQGSFLFVAGAAPDPAIGEDGQYALKTNGGPWQLWYKVAGVWQPQGIPVGTTFRGPWNNTTAYFGNDQVEHNGSTWGGLKGSTGVEPGTDASTWALSAAAGKDGMQGGAVAFIQVFSTSTSNSDPGDGHVRFNQASQPTATVIRVDYLDELGVNLQPLIASCGVGTSLIKGQFRICEIADPTRWLTFNVTAVSDMTGYFNVQGAAVSASPNPLRDGQRVVLFFTGKGDKGDTGAQGNQGWSPVLAVTSDNQRRVLQVSDWTGGAGPKPATGQYVGATGLVSAVADAIDIRGLQGLQGLQGIQGQGIQPNDVGTLAGRAAHDGEVKGYVYLRTDVTPNIIYVKNSAASADWSSGTPIGGAGDMLKSDNLSGLANLATSRTNLGLGDLATKNQSDLTDPFAAAIVMAG